jgi:hypothetical protein
MMISDMPVWSVCMDVIVIHSMAASAASAIEPFTRKKLMIYLNKHGGIEDESGMKKSPSMHMLHMLHV